MTTTLDLRTLTDESARASLMFDHASDPQALLDAITSAVDSLLSETGADSLPDDLCGAVMATSAAAGVALLQTPDEDVDPIAQFLRAMAIKSMADHAAEHGDSLGVVIAYSESPDDAYSLIVEWVVSHLAETVTDEALADVISPDFDAWERDLAESE